ncbi:(p)ppGpp synthase/HD superfamily hydrolase [Lysobacter niabensis]|uniref:(P)ppGpp synthase/HD superfamily hydrolase n=1 Tax=Agrilutibacter niabensis TaxID=380628 RepID=A0ABU1VTE2_9GAMM|nr:HD domain-containing protein [Lysobacter niabensis]MDR7100635.1 (p)ppGpp synthase/HD superfamily hydrolase [Lysobacter niabensis]
MTALTERFARAVDYARIAHTGQVRKGTAIPYLTHLLGVATLVIEHGGSEDQAIAGLLHDCIEDCGEAHEAIIRAQFGDTVARIVRACTDGTAEGKSENTTAEAKQADWLRRKRDYLKHLAEADDEVLLVSGCDKLHNALAIVADLENPDVGVKVFARFTGAREGTLAYYQSLCEVFLARGSRSARELDAAVARMHAFAGDASRQVLAFEVSVRGDYQDGIPAE